MKHLVDETSQKSAVEPLRRYMLHCEIRCQLYSYFTLVKAHLINHLLDETCRKAAVWPYSWLSSHIASFSILNWLSSHIESASDKTSRHVWNGHSADFRAMCEMAIQLTFSWMATSHIASASDQTSQKSATQSFCMYILHCELIYLIFGIRFHNAKCHCKSLHSCIWGGFG